MNSERQQASKPEARSFNSDSEVQGIKLNARSTVTEFLVYLYLA